MMKELKGIGISKIEFPYIGDDGIEKHEYLFDKDASVLIFNIDGEFKQKWSGLDAAEKFRKVWRQEC